MSIEKMVLQEKKNEEETTAILERALNELDPEITSDVLTENLMDPENGTWKVYETIAACYLNGSSEYRKGVDACFTQLTGWSLKTMTEKIFESKEENLGKE